MTGSLDSGVDAEVLGERGERMGVVTPPTLAGVTVTGDDRVPMWIPRAWATASPEDVSVEFSNLSFSGSFSERSLR